MKDYRQYSKPYTPEEWEKDKEWLAHRLDFLWTFCDYYTHLYQVGSFGEEKELLYHFYGSDNEFAKMAHDFHYDQYQNNTFKLDKMETIDLFNEYRKLKKAITNDMDNFLRKRLYIKYYFMRAFIEETQLYDDFRRYLKEYEYNNY